MHALKLLTRNDNERYMQFVLCYAIQNQQAETVKDLLDSGASAMAREAFFDKAPLDYALKTRNTEIIKLLLEKKEGIVHYCREPCLALYKNHRKTENTKSKHMSLLIKHGLDAKSLIAVKSETGDSLTTCLIYAVKRGWTDVIENLLDQYGNDTSFEVDMKDENGKSAFYHAMVLGRFDIASLLFEKGAEVTLEIMDLGFDRDQCELDNSVSPWISKDSGRSHDFVPRRLSKRVTRKSSVGITRRRGSTKFEYRQKV